MLKANSLLYAVYVCLIVSILCAGLLYLSTLYIRLNDFYNTHEELIIQNESTLNYALHNAKEDDFSTLNSNGYINKYSVNTFGLLDCLVIQSSFLNDTICSTYFISRKLNEKIALQLPSTSFPIQYSGKVSIEGKCLLPQNNIQSNYFSKNINKLYFNGTIESTEEVLPKVNERFNRFCKEIERAKVNQQINTRSDSLIIRSFSETTQTILLNSQNKKLTFKGNFILINKDSIVINNDDVLNDVIIYAPRIKIKEGFKGNAQFIASEKIVIEKNVTLNYPSALCIYNDSEQKSSIELAESVIIKGFVSSFGYPIKSIGDNIIKLGKNTLILGTVYCYGKLILQGKVIGSIFTNRIGGMAANEEHENCLIDVEISSLKLPDYFIPYDLKDNDLTRYEVIKKTY